VVAANFIAVAARMSLVTFLGIYFVRKAGIDLATVGVAFLCEHLLRGLAAPLFGAWSDRVGRRALLIASAALTAIVLPSFLLVEGPASLFAWSLALGFTGAVNMPVSNALLLDLSPPERRQSTLALNYTAMSVAYTLGVMPAGYVAELGYGYLAATAGAGYVMVAVLYAVSLKGVLPLERAPRLVLFEGLRDPSLLRFAAVGFIFPFSMGLVVSATPLFAADAGVGEGYIGLVLGANSILVAALALPVAARIEARGPLHFLGAAALIVAAAHACYAAIPGVAAALLVGTVVFSFAELIFSAAVPATVARLAPPGRRGVYQGSWALVASVSMGSALFFSGVLRDALGWRAAWGIFAAIALIAGFLLMKLRSERPGGG
jgi:MFS family permease